MTCATKTKQDTLGFLTSKTSKLTASNLRQTVLPRLKIHSILNNKVSLVHQTNVLGYEYSSHFQSVFGIEKTALTRTRMSDEDNIYIFFIHCFVCIFTLYFLFPAAHPQPPGPAITVYCNDHYQNSASMFAKSRNSEYKRNENERTQLEALIQLYSNPI